MRRVGDAGHMVGSRHWFGHWGGLSRVREGGRDRLLPLLRKKKKERGTACIRIKTLQTRMNPKSNGFVWIVFQGRH